MADALLQTLQHLLLPEQIITDETGSAHYRKGWRSGQGVALAVVFPTSLRQCWQILQACVAARCIIIMQAANTGLTEGSTPHGEDYDRSIVIINTLRLNRLYLLDNAKQVLCLPGTRLHQLEQALKPHQRAPHSVIGSSCLGATVVGGIANNSGGALVKRGPAYTEMALFAQVNADGELQLINHLGIELGEDPDTILQRLDTGELGQLTRNNTRVGSARDYTAHVRDIAADTPSRFNADPAKLYEASGCAGKIAVLAVRVDTFALPQQEQTFYIGTNDPRMLTELRRHMLTTLPELPEVAEYLHRDMFDIAERYGKDTFLSVKWLGTERLPTLFAYKGRMEAFCQSSSWLPSHLLDKSLQGLANLWPQHLPKRMRAFRDRYEHHLILKMSDKGITLAQQWLTQFFTDPRQGSFFVCDQKEAESALLHRFAAAGAAMRYQRMHAHRVGELLSLDIALRRNDLDWFEQLPAELAACFEQRLYYGHFFCYVFHQDYILKAGVDATTVKQRLLALLTERGARYPAEHNVGHLYNAEPALKAFYQQLDPTNTFNPGIGHTSKLYRHCGCC